jgi:hypothetical protein
LSRSGGSRFSPRRSRIEDRQLPCWNDDQPIPIACSLDADDYATRLAKIRAVGEGSLVSSEWHADGAGADLFFRDEGEIGSRLREVIAAEAKCCAFLDMRLDREDGRLRLSISGPADAEPFVQDLVQSFEAGGAAVS